MIVGEVVQEIIVDVLGLFAGYLAAKVLSVWNPAIGIIAEAVKGALQFALLVAYEWNDKMGLLVSSIVSFIMGFIALRAEIGKAFIEALCRYTSGAASAALTDLHWKLLHPDPHSPAIPIVGLMYVLFIGFAGIAKKLLGHRASQ